MDLVKLLHDSADEILAAAGTAVERSHLKNYERDGKEHTHQRLKALFVLTTRAVKERNLGPMIAHAETIAWNASPRGLIFPKCRLRSTCSKRRCGRES